MVFNFFKKRIKDEEMDGEESGSLKKLELSEIKKKREFAKPWGKTERLIILFVLLGTVIIASVLAISARDWKLPGLPRPDTGFIGNFFESFSFKEKTLIIESDQTNYLNKKNFDRAEKIKKSFQDLVNNQSGVYGLLVIDLETGFSFGINEQEKFQAASLIKLPVLAALYREAETNNFDLDSKYILKDADKIPGSGSLFFKPNGFSLSYRNLAKLMGKESDNTAFGIVRKTLGESKINSIMDLIGLNSTSLADNETTPNDIGIFLQKLWKNKFLHRESRDEILDYLTGTIYENWLAAGVPQDIRVAHKFGRELHVVNDAGIVFSPKPFVLVMLSKGVVERQADEIFSSLARVVYLGMTN